MWRSGRAQWARRRARLTPLAPLAPRRAAPAAVRPVPTPVPRRVRPCGRAATAAASARAGAGPRAHPPARLRRPWTRRRRPPACARPRIRCRHRPASAAAPPPPSRPRPPRPGAARRPGSRRQAAARPHPRPAGARQPRPCAPWPRRPEPAGPCPAGTPPAVPPTGRQARRLLRVRCPRPGTRGCAATGPGPDSAGGRVAAPAVAASRRPAGVRRRSRAAPVRPAERRCAAGRHAPWRERDERGEVASGSPDEVGCGSHRSRSARAPVPHAVHTRPALAALVADSPPTRCKAEANPQRPGGGFAADAAASPRGLPSRAPLGMMGNSVARGRHLRRPGTRPGEMVRYCPSEMSRPAAAPADPGPRGGSGSARPSIAP